MQGLLGLAGELGLNPVQSPHVSWQLTPRSVTSFGLYPQAAKGLRKPEVASLWGYQLRMWRPPLTGLLLSLPQSPSREDGALKDGSRHHREPTTHVLVFVYIQHITLMVLGLISGKLPVSLELVLTGILFKQTVSTTNTVSKPSVRQSRATSHWHFQKYTNLENPPSKLLSLKKCYSISLLRYLSCYPLNFLKKQRRDSPVPWISVCQLVGYTINSGVCGWYFKWWLEWNRGCQSAWFILRLEPSFFINEIKLKG